MDRGSPREVVAIEKRDRECEPSAVGQSMAAFRPSDASVGDSARYWGALVEIADSANPMIAVAIKSRRGEVGIRPPRQRPMAEAPGFKAPILHQRLTHPQGE